MRTKIAQEDDKEGAAKASSQPQSRSADRPNQTPELAAAFLQMQRALGNQFTRQMLAGSPTRRISVELQPHRLPDATLRALAPFYQAGKTPYVDNAGQIRSFEVAPADAQTAGRHVETIRQQYGALGVAQTMRGLLLTRGPAFATAVWRQASGAREMLAPRPAQAANVRGASGDELFASPTSTSAAATRGDLRPHTAGRLVSQVLSRGGMGQHLPMALRRKLAKLTGDRLTDVRIHNDSSAAQAAFLLGARAFTVGRHIYFGAGELNPASVEGKRLIAHEVAHAIQQRSAVMPALQHLPLSDPADAEEREAEQFAEAASHFHARPPRLALGRQGRAARIMRQITFSVTNNAFTTNTMGVGEAAGGFRIRPDAFPLFSWTADVTISGHAGDPFADFEAGPLQLVRNYWHNVYWGTGSDRTHRKCELNALPIRDATAAGNTWYHDALAQAFAANGDTRNTGLNDSPQSQQHPWANPVAGRGGTRGWFNYGVAFVAYISARDTTRGTGAGAFRALANVYWNTSVDGSFDTTQPVGSRVTANGGALNRSGVIAGGSGDFPSMHGGDIANTSHACADT